ncbi:MAG: N-6 DNA methylase [archaeon]|nr:N-6 DNA methylase [archaeon]
MVNIKQDKKAAFQIKRYCWSADLPLCILTNFEELAVYEKTKPNKNHNASIGRIKYYKYTDYVEKWDEIVSIFSKEAVRTGKFDNFVTGHQGIKKGTSEVDEEFLKEIENWRLILTKNISNRNKELPIEKLNHAVQLTIDRIIFLRIAEDRGIEKYKQLKDLLELSNDNKDEYPVYEGFIEICKKADVKYNSGLFHFKEEKGISLSADELTPNLKIDDGTFKQIFKNIYYPNCPYEFSVLPTEVLGNVYERFLGSKIRLTKSNKPKIEYKSEVKKAGGVFYTPQYIVDFIVENTIGVLLKGKTPNQVSKMRFVDPACGSGSFLLGAFQCLIDWHIKHYSGLKKPPKDVIYTGKDGITRLTVTEKKRIVLNNIYGVDIDPQAVEVSKLSLLLKVLEDSNKDELEAQQKLFQERALPYLGDNIRCGNSLINSFMLDGCDFDIDKIIELKPFNWEKEFSEVLESGGFDAVIGNPPYVKESTSKESFDGLRKSPYYQGKMDLWYFFGCAALDLVKDKGLVSFIATNNWITNSGASKFRNKVNDNAKFKLFVDFGNYKVFDTASIQTMIYIMQKNSSDNNYSFNYAKLLEDKISKKQVNEFLHSKDTVNCLRFKAAFNRKDNKDSYFNFMEKDLSKLLDKIERSDNVISMDSNELSQGIVSPQEFLIKKTANSLNNVYPIGTGVFVLSDEELNSLNLSDEELELIKPFYTTEELIRYYSNPKNKKWIIYTKSNINKYIKNYPNIKNHLNQFKRIITSSNKPYGLHRARRERIFTSEKIIVTRKCAVPTFSYADFDAYVSQTFMVINSERFNLKYATGILNSKLIQFWLKYKGKMQGNNYQLDKEPLLKIPLILTNNEQENKLIDLVESIIDLNERLISSSNSNQKRILEDQIEIKDNKLNQLVYELYELTDEEIEIVENSLMN